MKQRLHIIFLVLAFTLTAAAQTEATDTVSVSDTVDCAIPQIPFNELDGLYMEHYGDRYVVVHKNGKYGVYDLRKKENVTRIEYEDLSMKDRKMIRNRHYTFFIFKSKGQEGLLRISEESNKFVTIP
ncbi:MAG: hypothetical protein J6W24_06770 [Prevotella sp.]|nr:hypothetical protein [Prevotella sp.]